jgi:hypothetical protein
MSDLAIEHLNLHLSGFSQEDGRHLAQLIAAGLSNIPAPAGVSGKPAVRLDVEPRRGASLEQISTLVLADLIRELERSV